MNGQDQRSSETSGAGQVPPEIVQAPSLPIPADGVGEILSNQAPQLNQTHLSFADFQQGYVTSYIQFADTKAAWVFAVASASIAYAFSSENIQWVMHFQRFGWLSALIVVTVVLLVSAAALSFLVISPRFSSSGDGVVFFTSVAKRATSDEFVRELARMGDLAIIEARLKHGYDISRVCARKYRLLAIAFKVGIVGLVGMALVILIT